MEAASCWVKQVYMTGKIPAGESPIGSVRNFCFAILSLFSAISYVLYGNLRRRSAMGSFTGASISCSAESDSWGGNRRPLSS